MTERELKALVDSIFTDGNGNRAERLELLSEDRIILGCWGRAALATRIRSALNESEARAKVRRSRKG